MAMTLALAAGLTAISAASVSPSPSAWTCSCLAEPLPRTRRLERIFFSERLPPA
jgi:hypothetical protein